MRDAEELELGLFCLKPGLRRACAASKRASIDSIGPARQVASRGAAAAAKLSVLESRGLDAR